MTNQERKNRLEELKKACKKRMNKLENEINNMWDYKKNKPKKGFEEEIQYLKKDLQEEQITLDTYEYLEYELDI